MSKKANLSVKRHADGSYVVTVRSKGRTRRITVRTKGELKSVTYKLARKFPREQ